MLRLVLFILIAITTFPQASNAKDTSYFDMELPVMTSGQNVSRSNNDQDYSVSLSYEIVIESTEPVCNFYHEFFKKQGWENLGYTVSGKWDGYSANISPDGKAVFGYSAMWQSKDAPVSGSVNLIINDYKEGHFHAKVQVSLIPELNDDPYYEFSELLKDPKNIFILQKAIGSDPFQLENMKPDLISKEYQDELIIKEYKKLIEKTLQQYKDFGEQYVHRTKPIDGKFEKHFPSEFNSDPSTDNGIDQDEQEDPLDRWRALQEEQEKEKSKVCECPK